MDKRILATAVLAVGLGAGEIPAQNLDEMIRQTTVEYTRRLVGANEELNAARERIALEREPLLFELREAQDRIIAAESEMQRIQIAQSRAADRSTALEHDITARQANIAYVVTLAQDGIKGLEGALSAGEREFVGKDIAALGTRLQRTEGGPDSAAALEALDLLVRRLEQSIGGYTAAGECMLNEDNAMLPGTFVFFGPETFFVSSTRSIAGTVRVREGSTLPVVYPLATWDPAAAAALARGEAGAIPGDVTGGKALRLQQARGTLGDHIRKGGVVGYVIIALGAFALIGTLVKVIDLRKLSVDRPAAIDGVLGELAAGSRAQAAKMIETLASTTRALFTTGLRHFEKPKELLEEHLYAFLLRERLHHERRLPLLAVIAAAAPLLGLLGTVTGMVRTFTLIQVYGTGNAGKLSTGISEALVTTELGLIVAIPTLVIHGYLSHRTQRNLALLERYSVEFVSASEEKRLSPPPGGGPGTGTGGPAQP
jgi:biopolymer transport protein ExbB